MKEKKYEDPPKPELRQYENRKSAPFYCSLCGMSELEIMNRKTKDGKYYCGCSFWSDPHNAYIDKSGGKWLGWYDKKRAQEIVRGYSDFENGYNQALKDINQKQQQWLKENL